MTYRRRASPLHAARASIGGLWCLALVVVALVLQHPVVLAASLAAVLLAGTGAKVGRAVRRSLLFGVPFGLLILLVNVVVTRNGLTVVGQLLGQDLTLEAVVAGAISALSVVVLVAVAVLYSAAVDPDELLRAFRRVSPRSALSAALATRMVPVLARDARRLADAQRCRAGAPASQLAIVRAVTSGALDRALDVAATLEVRGYGSARSAPAVRRPWSRHDLAFAASAAGLVAVAVLGDAPVTLYPRTSVTLDGEVLATAAAVLAVALAPFADRRGTGR